MPERHSILVLGAGAVGQAAVRYAAEQPAIGRILVADRNAEAASRAALAARGKGEAATVDVTDHAALTGLMARHHAVLNCVGPFFRFGPPVLRAALAAGTPYLDICDDPEPTLQMLDFDAEARARRTVAVIGQGASPGTANLLAMRAAAELPGAHTLITGWSLDDDPGDPGGAANEHWMEQATGTIKLWRSGVVEEAPLAEMEVELPGFAPRIALTIGHPEAVTIPRTLSALSTCVNVMTLPSALAATLKRAARAVDVEGLGLMEASHRELARHVPGSGPELPVYPGVWALAIGAGGRAGAWLPDYGSMHDMATTTAAPLVAGLDLLLAGRVARDGVLAPEQAFQPADYFAALGRVAGIAGPVVRVSRA